ncbi:hypothetical protein Tco_0968643 [Tanacetum coccineum]
MTEENIAAPTKSDDQLVPMKARLPYGKSNLLLDLQKAFTTLANVPSIYIQQFWNTLTQEAKSGVYSFQLDKQWFPLNVDLLREALEIIPLWRAMLTLINQCLTGKTSGSDKPRHPVLQMLWGIVTRSNIDYVELLWEEFVQRIQTFFSHWASLSIPSKKSTPHVIPYCRFTKLIIYYLGSRHNIHRIPESPVYVTGDDFPLGNLKFQYLDMAAPKPTAKRDEQKKTTSATDKPKKPTLVKKPAPAKQTKPMKEKSTKSSPLKKVGKGKVRKVQKGKSSLQLVDEDEKAQPEPEPQAHGQAPVGGVAIREPNLETTRKLPVVEGKGKGIATDEHDDTSANIVRDTPSPPDAETGAEAEMSNSEGDTKILNVGKDVSNTMDLEERTVALDEGQAGSDPGNTLESRPPPDEDQAGSNPGPSHVALAGPNPEPMHEDFIATVYPKVHESLKHTTEEQVFLENPPSSFGTLSLMKNLDDDFTYDDQFLYDKPMKEEQGKANVETKVESIVTVPIHQASSTVPPLSTPIIDLTQLKPVSPPIQEPIFTTTITTTTTTLPLPPPLQQQSSTDSALAARIFTLENHDLYSKIDKYINEKVKEAVQDALQALLRKHFRELSGFEMKEILCDRMFKSGSYRSQPEHTALYDALEASMDREKREEFMDATSKCRSIKSLNN